MSSCIKFDFFLHTVATPWPAVESKITCNGEDFIRICVSVHSKFIGLGLGMG